MSIRTLIPFLSLLTTLIAPAWAGDEALPLRNWQSLPDLPDPLGVAGPFVGVDDDVLIVAGGANFSRPVWTSQKAWTDRVHVLVKKQNEYQWIDGGRLRRPLAYGGSVSTDVGLLCIGGNDSTRAYSDVYLLSWQSDAAKLKVITFPSLPKPCAYTSAALVGSTVYVAGGQAGGKLDSAMKNFWALDLSLRSNAKEFTWREVEAWPGPGRAFCLLATHSNGADDCLYLLSGRRQQGDKVDFLRDVYEFNPRKGKWRRCQDAPQCVMAGTAIGYPKHGVYVLGGADGSLFFQADELKDRHPGFPKEAFLYNPRTDSWSSVGRIPANQVTTTAVRWQDGVVIASGEVRPRVRSPKVWLVKTLAGGARQQGQRPSTWPNYVVVLLVLVSIGALLRHYVRE